MVPVSFLLALLLPIVLASPVDRFEVPLENHDDFATTRFLLMRNEVGELEMTDLLAQNVTYHAKEDDVTFHLYTLSNLEDHEVIVSENFTDSKYFDPKKETVFVIHGWRDDYLSELNGLIKNNMLANYDVNVIVVDWSYASKRNYLTSMWSVTTVGKIVAKFIQELSTEYGIDLMQFALVGHSLGAHVSGNAGAALDGQIRYIMGLDPAGPLFTYGNTGNRLDPTDAQYVEVIHTSLFLGFHKPIGHGDFFPNGGLRQPGCGLDLDSVCAHSRSYEYYAESLNNNQFLGTRCASYDEFEAGLCQQNRVAPMGRLDIDKKVRGSYYLNTRGKEPYAKN